MKLFTLLVLLNFEAFSQMRALDTAATGMATQEANVNTISNNIANVNTIGFKKQRAESTDLFYQTVKEAGARSSNNTTYNVGVQIGSGSKISGIRKIFDPGGIQQTNRPFDLMIQGDGFFGVQMPNGAMRYTRDGSFDVNQNGILVTKKGFPVFPTVTMPSNTLNYNISENGTVEVFIKNQREPNVIGQIPVFTFVNSAGLKSLGGNLYAATKSSGVATQQISGENNAGSIVQGALETSNVNIMNEMTNLIKAQRSYEMNSKVMGIADQMLQTVNNIK